MNFSFEQLCLERLNLDYRSNNMIIVIIYVKTSTHSKYDYDQQCVLHLRRYTRCMWSTFPIMPLFGGIFVATEGPFK